MESVYKNIFRAIFDGKWLSIEYENTKGDITRYWIAIKAINVQKRMLLVDGLHVMQHTIQELNIFVDSIRSSVLVEETYYEVPNQFKDDISNHPDKYNSFFHSIPNLKILSYLMDCNKLNTVPYQCEYALIKCFDGDSVSEGAYNLSPEQYQEILHNFQSNLATKKGSLGVSMKQLCLNVLSVHTKKGLYVLAYRGLRLDVKSKRLVADDEVTICTEFTIDGNKESIRKFLDADDYELLTHFDENLEQIKDQIMNSNRGIYQVDDMPYIIALARNLMIDLTTEYAAITKMFEENQVTIPIKAFFGELVKPPIRKKDYPIILLNKKINIDQLLAIHNATKNPLTYVQGPPGTGKTNTIIGTIITAFFNDKTVLFTSYNNHPIKAVFETLRNIEYKGKKIPFPIFYANNSEEMRRQDVLKQIKELYDNIKNTPVYEQTLEKNKDNRTARMHKLSEFLARHEEIIELNERKDSIEKLLSISNHLMFQVELQGEQLQSIKERLREIGDVTNEEAIKLLEEDEEELLKYLYYTSVKFLKRLAEPKYADLIKILEMEDTAEQVREFYRYLGNDENMKKFIRVFPVVASTCISAHKLGEPRQYFDMVIMDEASQANTAVSLVPILRGNHLMLVGDPQQLNPVIVLDAKDNAILKKRYQISEEYDYCKNSIYKVFLACDSVSGEILLSHHYRCNRKIIGFNNKKYYNNKLIIESKNDEKTPLVYVDIEDNTTNYKNTSPYEAEQIVKYVEQNKDKKIGIITPFTNQKDCINNLLKDHGLEHVTCGTVHAFQGDEKDEILFSTAVTDRTTQKTYSWLKNNKELINVATSRAKDRLIVFSSQKELDRLHYEMQKDADDLYEMVRYVQTNGASTVTVKQTESRALGIKPYSTQTEEAFLESLNHALDNILNTNRRCVIRKEVGISHVFSENTSYSDLFYSGRFDFVVYERDFAKREIPILAIELDGKEHYENAVVQERDRKKNEICKQHGFELIRVENSYARRYQHIKNVLINYFERVNK